MIAARRVEIAPGGKGATQAAARRRLGPGVHLVGRVGDDRQLATLAGRRLSATCTVAGPLG